MPRRHWSIVVALVGWLALAATQPPPKQAETQNGANNSAKSIPAYAPYPELYAGSCYKTKDHDTADLCAQWRAALAAEKAAKAAREAVIWTIVATILSGLAVAGLLWSLSQTERSLGEARKGNKLTEETAKRELRAYVIGKDQRVEKFYSGGKPEFIVHLHNFGQTPAYDVRCVTLVRATVDLATHRFFFRERPLVGHLSRALLGPGDFHVHRNEMQKALTHDAWTQIVTGGMYLIYAGVISYRDAFGKRHLTTFKQVFEPNGDIKSTVFDLTTCTKGNKAN